MTVLKCKMCGAPLQYSGGSTVVTCDYCDSVQTVSQLDNEKILDLYVRANQYRALSEFDKASVLYDTILVEKSTESEAHWGICLCRYGIEYVEDPQSHKRIPTCHRTQFKSILDDPNYLAAIQNADPSAREVYAKEAQYIDTVQKGILSISSKEDPFDIFICYKESDFRGDRTLDSVLAQDIYNKLTDIGYRVFFSRITLEDKLGSAYEPYIFAALSSAKIMLVVGTKPEHLDAVWVKNEWSRYLSFIGQGQEKTIIPCYRDMNPYQLPKEFVALQSQDMGKIGAMQDLVRGIEKILPLEKETVKETVVIQQGATTATTQSLLKRMSIYLEDGDWTNADQYSERVLDMDPTNASAYLGKLMIELKVRTEDQLRHCAQPFDQHNFYQKAYRYGDDSLKRKLDNANTYIQERNRVAQQERLYSSACERLSRARSAPVGQKNSPIQSNCGSAYEQFKQILGYKDAQSLMEECRELMYAHACAIEASATNDETFQMASALFYGIPDYSTYRDVMDRANQCLNRAALLRQERLYLSARQSEQTASSVSLRDAIRNYSAVGNYKDALQRLQNCRNKLTKLEEEQKEKQDKEAKAAEKQAKKDSKKRKSKRGGSCLWRIIKFYLIASLVCIAIGGGIALLLKDQNSSDGYLEILILNADLTEFNIGDTIHLTVESYPENPKYVKTQNESQVYFSNSNVSIYLRDGEDSILVDTGLSAEYTFDESGEYVFYAKYCPHSDWDCDPAYDITSEDVTVNVSGNPISTIEELKAMDNQYGDYQLTCDIDLEGIEWTPINFSGNFSGGGYTIYNLTINSDEDNIGFFGRLDGNVRDINFDNVTINASGRPISVGTVAGTVKGSVTNISVEVGSINASKGTNVGGIVGLATTLPKYAAFKNLHSTLNVKGSNRTGGLIGAIESSSADNPSTVVVKDCSCGGEINGKESVGGLFGYIQLDDTGIDWGHNDYIAQMDTLYSSCTVNGDTQVGGIIGYAKTNTHASYLKNATNLSSVYADAIAGGIAGKLEALTADNCTNDGCVSANGSVTIDNVTCAYVGGIVGYGSVVTNCSNYFPIEYSGNGQYVGGLAGYIGELPETVVMENNHNYDNISGQSYVGGLFGAIYSNADSDHNVTMRDCSNSGAIVGSNNVGGLYGSIQLIGNYYTKVIHMTTQSNTGSVNGTYFVGGIVGFGHTNSNDSILKDSTNCAEITAQANVGCVAGWLENIAIDSCSNEGSSLTATGYITADGIKYAHVGGYVGRGYIVNRCTNTVAIDYNSTGECVGGIAGYITGLANEITMEELQNTADISGASYVGGIFGELNSSCDWAQYLLTLLDFTNEGNVSGTDYVGGIIGNLFLDDTRSDILSNDYCFAVEMDAMYNHGAVSGKNYVGGILGYGKTDSTQSTMSDVASTGTVSGKSYSNSINGKVENITVK